MSPTYYYELAKKYEDESAKEQKKYDVLKDLDVFVLDNSLRESTVAMLRGHTIDDKWKIYNEVQSLGFKNMIIASLSTNTRVDDLFIKQLVEQGKDLSGLWNFSEITAGTTNKIPDKEKVPVSLAKMKDLGMYNPILEVDLGDAVYDFEKFSMDDLCILVEKWIRWSYNNLHKDSKVFINIRDPQDSFPNHSSRVFHLVDYLANLAEDVRPFGLLFEEPTGNTLPEEVQLWSKFIREVMNKAGWNGHLLIHIHEKYGFCEFTQLKGLTNGCNGFWASVCSEGAAMGHACSTTTLTNIIRLGNRKVSQKYKCELLRKAAINVTEITTGYKPHPKHIIYGSRALDYVFSMANDPNFDLATFFGVESVVRMTTLTPVPMIQTRLINVFGEDDNFNLVISGKMKDVMIEDLSSNRKEEYMSSAGLAVLYDRAGGKLTAKMSEVIAEMKVRSPFVDQLLKKVRSIWNEYDKFEYRKDDDLLEFDSFYHAFMMPYFGCYRCKDTMAAMRAIDMDKDGQVSWNEFTVYLKWAMNQYPTIQTVDELMDCAFRKGIIPAMRDELR